MNKFDKVLLNEIKKLNQARRFNNEINKNNKTLAQLNSNCIKAQLDKLQKRKVVI